MSAFVCLIEAELHLGEAHDLKGKRKLVKSLKDQLQNRGVAVAETDHHDKWQRASLLVALVGDGEIEDRADAVQRLIESRCPDGCSVRRHVRSLTDLRD
jgi:uncharacterized protein YlxP (DUF503 family)